ncbi:carbon-nitrogen hydrolase [Paenalcaligenes niemegkensis]|uniref:nitrilase-related carbon-nitrogen hydrolase n=1 Tax=Paenalcaligenes niemegkensis TaxID=2895469 RepID=UPI001EE83C84|nr:nitrilase-related carbon-nitrogen hydrolase [Paenalcaligenes niemegkensis]MCQ9616529.1 carbon-nitrogen hydrolase [Paenalcaligenes niemegkensis]
MFTLELAQITFKDGDIVGNLEKVVQIIRKAKSSSDILIFPETCFSGFPTHENVENYAQSLQGEIVKTLEKEAKEKGIAVLAGICEEEGGKYYNSSIFIDPEKGRIATYRKTHMWLTDRGLFTPGDRFISFEWRGVRIGLLICFDIEFPESGRANAELNVDLLLVVNGNMDPYSETHRTAIKARAQENQFYAAFVNRVGEDDFAHQFAGGSCVVNPFGETLCEAGREEMILQIKIDPLKRREYQKQYHYLNERAFQYNHEIIYEDGISILKIIR